MTGEPTPTIAGLLAAWERIRPRVRVFCHPDDADRVTEECRTLPVKVVPSGIVPAGQLYVHTEVTREPTP